LLHGERISYDGIATEEITMSDKTDWEARAKGLLKGELKRRNMTYAQLVDRLAESGVAEEEHNLRNKVARGKFTAAFMLQCLAAIGCKTVRVTED
jgi:hypothetical protein